jgi:multidrug efflux pump subunit AcrA (membrane-fusion protein)
MKHPLKIDFHRLIPAIVIILLMAGCGDSKAIMETQKASPAKGKKVPVEVAVVRKQNLQRYLEGTGSFFPQEEVRVSSQVAGEIVNYLAEEGDRVKKGQLLAVIDEHDYRLQVETAEARFKEARAVLEKLLKGPREQEIDAARAAVEEARAELVNAGKEYKRKQELFSDHMVSEQQLDQAQARAKIAQARLKSAEENLKLLLAGSREEDITAAQARVTALEAALSLARKRLKDTRITSPIEGVVRERDISAGEYVKVGQVLFVIIQTDPLKLVLDVPERFAGQLKPGLRVEVKLDAYPDRVFGGEVSLISPNVAQETRTIRVEARISNREGLLKPGFFGHTRLLTRSEEVLVIPKEALIKEAGVGVYHVFVVKNDTAQYREVIPGQSQGNLQEVTRGLAEGEMVITSGYVGLHTGTPVQVKERVR